MHYHDKQTPYTAATHYEAEDGQLRNFTHVDHDRKTTISVPGDGTNPQVEIDRYRSLLVEKILAIPAVYCNMLFVDYTLRGEKAAGTVKWNATMLEDKGVPLTQLQDIYTLASNMQDLSARTGH